jgi:S-adenosylmethionine synthetase
VAKNVVAAGLARRCEVQVAYAIGVAEPVSVRVDTFGTGTLEPEKLARLVRKHFDLTPRGIIEALSLRQPRGWCYRETAFHGHFGRRQFPWEDTSRAEALRRDAAR